MNGVWVGVHRDPSMLVRTLRQMRRQVNISTEVWHTPTQLLPAPQFCSSLAAASPPRRRSLVGAALHLTCGASVNPASTL